jgi:hypothetical protein
LLLLREQVNFQLDDDEVRFVLDQHAKLDFYSASSLKHAGRHVGGGGLLGVKQQSLTHYFTVTILFIVEMLVDTCSYNL